MSIMDTIGANPVIITGGRFQTRNPHHDDTFINIGEPIAATKDFPGVGEVRFLAHQHITVGQGIHGKGYTNGRIGKILQHGGRCNQFPGDLFPGFGQPSGGLHQFRGTGRRGKHRRTLQKCSAFHSRIILMLNEYQQRKPPPSLPAGLQGPRTGLGIHSSSGGLPGGSEQSSSGSRPCAETRAGILSIP